MISAERKEWIVNHQQGRCFFCKERLDDKVVDFHHYLVHDTKSNRKRYRFLVDSVVNAIAVCRQCHDKRGNEVQEFGSDYAKSMLDSILRLVEILHKTYPFDDIELMAEFDFIRRDVEKELGI